MRILVTGGAGFIGSHLVDRLVELGHKVFVNDDFSGGKIENLRPDVELLPGDLRVKEIADLLIKKTRPEIVFHLACNAAENKAQFSPIDITSRSYNTFINVLTPFIKYGGRRFVFTSSIAVYGALQTPFRETDKPEPEDLYGITKLACEQTLKVMSEVHGFEYVIARPHNVYGPRQNMSDPYRNVVTIFMNYLMKSYRPIIYGDGEQRRCFSYIDDVVKALCNCGFGNVNKMTFNIGSDSEHTVNELYKTICEVMGCSTSPTYISDRPQEVKVAVSDHTEAKKHLDYQDKTSLREGIQKTWEWVKSVGYQEPVYDKLEIINEKVPANWLINE